MNTDAIRWGCRICHSWIDSPPALEIKEWNDGHTCSVICWDCLDDFYRALRQAESTAASRTVLS